MLKPLGDRVVVKFEEVEEQTAGGFVLAGKSHEATKKATVVAIGQGLRTLNGDLIAPSVAVDDLVLVENGAGIDIKDGDEKLAIVRESDILAILG
ncbi:co-chaperone GroES [Streptococcus gallinaceus]|uniref:Co-chaperonin GroES n=1 Tax=Streptococcus gallinaceus TaxID=165758 RepID=A0ABV2JLY4_9STRE|nr:co-chaperone GroES [Streptococcus gallinaceus]MCP1639891.1 chaperonin GroES [Streptococcus gallinaceus]MCP1770737.1 chaperonin GroES [Streptococcus gallinaceus]